MLLGIARNWWMLLLNGIAAIAFGVAAFAWPGMTLVVLVMLFGIYCLADGFTAIGLAVVPRGPGRHWWQMLPLGLLAIFAGIAAFAWPGLTAITLLLIIAGWAIIRGVLEIVAAIELRKVIEHEWLLALAGVASIAFGFFLIARPGAGALAVVWIIGSYAIAHGVLLTALAFRARRLKDRLEHMVTGDPRIA